MSKAFYYSNYRISQHRVNNVIDVRCEDYSTKVNQIKKRLAATNTLMENTDTQVIINFPQDRRTYKNLYEKFCDDYSLLIHQEICRKLQSHMLFFTVKILENWKI